MTIAHIAIDLQKLQTSKPSVCGRWSVLKENIDALTTRLQLAGAPTVYVACVNQQLDSRAPPLTAHIYAAVNPIVDRLKNIQETDLWKITIGAQSGLGFDFPVKEEDWVAIKVTPSACVEPMTGFLKDRGIKTLILSGLWEDDYPRENSYSCVTASAIDFVRAGFRVIIVAEATNQHIRNQENLTGRICRHQQFGVEVMPIRDTISLVQQAKLKSLVF